MTERYELCGVAPLGHEPHSPAGVSSPACIDLTEIVVPFPQIAIIAQTPGLVYLHHSPADLDLS
jgi:hypothetical protein